MSRRADAQLRRTLLSRVNEQTPSTALVASSHGPSVVDALSNLTTGCLTFLNELLPYHIRSFLHIFESYLSLCAIEDRLAFRTNDARRNTLPSELLDKSDRILRKEIRNGERKRLGLDLYLDTILGCRSLDGSWNFAIWKCVLRQKATLTPTQ